MNFRENECAKIFAFDEVIGRNSDYEGIPHKNVIRETKNIIKFLLDKECFTDKIGYCILSEFNKIIDDTIIIHKDNSSKYYDKFKLTNDIDDLNKKKNNNYFLCGWQDHAIFMFYEKVNDNNYNFGIINAGIGVEIHGFINDLCNGIIIFKNIKWCNILHFMIDYQYFKYYNQLDINFQENYRLCSFYFLLIDRLLNIKKKVDIHQLKEENKIDVLEINPQILGTCTFTNYINYIIYILYKNKDKEYNKNFNLWYEKSKKEIKKKIFNEIIFNKDYYNFTLYKYILDTVDELKINKRYKNRIVKYNIYEANKKNYKIIIEYEKKKDNINRNNITLSEIFWKLYNFDNSNFITLISELNDKIKLNNIIFERDQNYRSNYREKSPTGKSQEQLSIEYDCQQKLIKESQESLRNILREYFSYFKSCNSFNNNYYFITCLFEIYKLKKYNNIQLSEHILNDIKYFIEDNLDNVNNHIRFIYACILLLLFEDKGKKYYNNEDIEKINNNKRKYIYLLSEIPIINGNYIVIIKDIINDVISNINYYPDFFDSNELTDHKYETYFYNGNFYFVLIKIKRNYKLFYDIFDNFTKLDNLDTYIKIDGRIINNEKNLLLNLLFKENYLYDEHNNLK